MKRKNNYKFTKKKHSKRGIVSCSISAGSVIALFFVVIRSFQLSGEGSIYLGSVGIFGFLLTIAAMITAVQSFKEEDSFRLFPRLSIVLSFLLCTTWTLLYAGGLYLLF